MIAILLMVVATTMSVSALREAFLRFVVETYETFTCVFVGDEKQHEETYEFVPVEPTYIPKGYQLVSEIRDPSTFCLIYQRGDEVFDYYQTIALGGRFGLDTEGTEYEKLYINGNEALYSHNKGISTILLYRDPCVFVINGNANKEELLEIMQSVKFN